MSPPGSRYPRTPMSTTAASHLSPAFPERAAWGTASKLPRLAGRRRSTHTCETDPRDFLAVATPGAGKTTYALRLATELLAAARSPAGHRSWRPPSTSRPSGPTPPRGSGIHIDPKFSNSSAPALQRVRRRGADLRPGGQQAAAAPHPHRVRAHPGDPRRDPPRRRRAVLGRRDPRGVRARHPPARAHRHAVPLGHLRRSRSCTYAEDRDGIRRSSADYTYGYAEALRDGVVRPVLFLAYGGAMRWRTKAGDEIAARLGELLTKDSTAQAWRTALDPKGEWIPSVLRRRRQAADRGAPRRARRGRPRHRHRPDRRRGPTPRSSRRSPARSRVVVLSDDAGSSARIEEFAAGDQRWMVAVRMVSEGVDVPRLVRRRLRHLDLHAAVLRPGRRPVRPGPPPRRDRVGVPAQRPADPRARRPAGGRARPRARPAEVGQRRGLDVGRGGRAARRGQPHRAAPPTSTRWPFEALESDAEFDHVLFDAKQFGLNAATGSDEEQEYLGLPGLLEPDQMAVLLRERQSAQSARRPARKAEQQVLGRTARSAAAAQGAQQARGGLRPQERRPARRRAHRPAPRTAAARPSTRRPPSRSTERIEKIRRLVRRPALRLRPAGSVPRSARPPFTGPREPGRCAPPGGTVGA